MTRPLSHFDATDKCDDSTAKRAAGLQLPRHLPDEAAYHARAELIYERALALMRGLTGNEEAQPELRRMDGTEYGFTSGTDSVSDGKTHVVSYQNAYELVGEALQVNRDVMQVRDHETFMCHAEMMLYWFIPHELVHVFRNRAGSWYEELVANTVQPYLTARLIEEIDCPYNDALFREVYASYSQQLEPLVDGDFVDAVTRFIHDPEHPDPLGTSAWSHFLQFPLDYVYFGARVNLAACAQQHTLEGLVDEHLK